MPLKTRPVEELKFYSQREDDYLPRHSMVYSEQGLGRWVKDFDIFYELYFEENELLRPMECFIYRHLLSLSNRGLAVSIKEYARHLHMHHMKLVEHLDRLQDALLLYRVCRTDTQGRPNDLVLMSPLSRKQWAVEGEKVIERVNTQCTRLDRRELGAAWPGEDFKFSQRRITTAFDGDGRRAEEFTLLVLDLLFQLATKQWRGREARRLFEEQLMKGAERKKIFIDESKFLAALEIQRRYARTLFKVD